MALKAKKKSGKPGKSGNRKVGAARAKEKRSSITYAEGVAGCMMRAVLALNSDLKVENEELRYNIDRLEKELQDFRDMNDALTLKLQRASRLLAEARDPSSST